MKQKYEGVTVEEAICRITEIAKTTGVANIALERALGRVLAEDIVAGENVPSFDRSPWDGYALRAEDTVSASPQTPVTLALTGEIPAGKQPETALLPGQAAKILTGAPLPPGANVTIKYEDTEYTDTAVTLTAPLAAGRHIARAGEDVRAGARVLTAGTKLTPPSLGLMAALGVERPLLYARPRIAVLATGSELSPVSGPLPPGKIRVSNVYMFSACLRQAGAETVNGGMVADDTERIAQALDQALQNCDMVVSGGGVSAGDYDLVPAAAQRLGGRILFRRVCMKPGAGLLAAVIHGKLLLALSGNPSAALTGLQLIGLPFVRKLCGQQPWQTEIVRARLRTDLPRANRERLLLRGQLVTENGECAFEPINGREQGALAALLAGNALADIPADSGPLNAGTLLSVYRL